MSDIQTTSTQPYLIRAWVEWCNDYGLTPYLSVRADKSVQVPREFVKDGEIVLNISYDATSALKLGNDFIEFTARFGGVPRELMFPVGAVIGIFARENGAGMEFAYEPTATPEPGEAAAAPTLTAVDQQRDAGTASAEKAATKSGRPPHLQRIK